MSADGRVKAVCADDQVCTVGITTRKPNARPVCLLLEAGAFRAQSNSTGGECGE